MSISDGVGESNPDPSEAIQKRLEELEGQLAVYQQQEKDWKLLRLLIDHLPDLLYIKDIESRFILGNLPVANLMGKESPNALIGKTDFDFYPEDLASQYYEDEQQLLQSGASIVNVEEPSLNTQTGQQGWMLTSKMLYYDETGHVAGLMGIGRNITELKETQLELEQAHQRLEERVEARTAELAKPNAQLQRAQEFMWVTIETMTEAIQRGAEHNELLVYLRQAQTQFDRLT